MPHDPSMRRQTNVPPTPSVADAPIADGRPATIAIGGFGTVTVAPLRTIRDGAARCAVDLTIAHGATQRLVLIGEGETEALICDGILAFGAVPAPDATARIAFLYRGHSPNAKSLSPVFVSRALSGGAWTTDDELGQKIGEHGKLDTIPKIRAELKRTKR